MVVILGATFTIVVIAFLSLLVTSDGLTPEQRQMVTEAVGVVERSNFTRDAAVLNHVVFYRSSDNWWNKHVGHQNAYAATNFPFAVVTLYPAFFRVPVDATERAAILLHESQHVFGVDEPTALQRVWLGKGRLAGRRSATAARACGGTPASGRRMPPPCCSSAGRTGNRTASSQILPARSPDSECHGDRDDHWHRGTEFSSVGVNSHCESRQSRTARTRPTPAHSRLDVLDRPVNADRALLEYDDGRP